MSWPVYDCDDDDKDTAVKDAHGHKSTGNAMADFVWDNTHFKADARNEMDYDDYAGEDEEEHMIVMDAVASDRLADVVKAVEACGSMDNRQWYEIIYRSLSRPSCVDVVTYLLNAPNAQAAVKIELPGGKDGSVTIFCALHCSIPSTIVDLLLFMGAPNRNSQGNYFWESRTRARTIGTNEVILWKKLEKRYLAVKEAIHSIFAEQRLTNEIFAALLPFCAGCVVF
jgi:hypothetical protein